MLQLFTQNTANQQETIWQIGTPIHRDFISCIEIVVLKKLSEMKTLHEMGRKILEEQNKKLNDEKNRQKEWDELSNFYYKNKEFINFSVLEGFITVNYANSSYIHKLLKRDVNDTEIKGWEESILSSTDAELLKGAGNSKLPQNIQKHFIDYTGDCLKQLQEIVADEKRSQSPRMSKQLDYRIAHYCAQIYKMTQTLRSQEQTLEIEQEKVEEVLKDILANAPTVESSAINGSRARSISINKNLPITRNSRSSSLSESPLVQFNSLKDLILELALEIDREEAKQSAASAVMGFKAVTCSEFSKQIRLIVEIFSKYKTKTVATTT